MRSAGTPASTNARFSFTVPLIHAGARPPRTERCPRFLLGWKRPGTWGADDRRHDREVPAVRLGDSGRRVELLLVPHERVLGHPALPGPRRHTKQAGPARKRSDARVPDQGARAGDG